MFSIAIGSPTKITVSGKEIIAPYAGWDEDSGSGRFLVDGKVILRKLRDSRGNIIREQPQELPSSKFTIDERFHFMENFIDMTVTGSCNALVICGEGGLGKSWTVAERLRLAGKKEIIMEEDGNRLPGDYEVVKGHTTPKALFRSLYENREGILIYDDCDAALKDSEAVQILKCALDSYEQRYVSWMIDLSRVTDLPRRFEFKGKVIFLSNLSLNRVPQPLLSRSVYVDVDMTAAEKFQRMRKIAPNVLKSIPLNIKMEVISFMETLTEEIGDLNMRTFGKACLIVQAYPSDWKKRVEYLVTAL